MKKSQGMVPSSSSQAEPSFDTACYEREIAQKILRETKQTTRAAERSWKTAEKTRSLAQSTLGALHIQEENMKATENSIETIHEDVQHAKSVLKYMRRLCCCFLCIYCDCDPDLERDANRAALRKQRKKDSKQAAKLRKMDEKQSQEVEQERQAAAADTSGWAGGIKAKQKENHALQLELHGKLVNGLEDGDRDEVLQHVQRQDVMLDKIGTALDDLSNLSKNMSEALDRQAIRVAELDRGIAQENAQLHSMSSKTRRTYGLT